MGASIGAGMLYKHYTKKRVLVIDLQDHGKYYENDEKYKDFIKDKIVIANLTYKDKIPEKSSYDKVIIISYSGINDEIEYVKIIENLYSSFNYPIVYDYSKKTFNS